MKYDFDTIIDRRGTGSVRWDNARKKYGEPELIPLTTADMDFKVPPAVRDAMCEAANFGIFGYTQPKDSYYEAVADRLEKRSDWKVERSWIMYSAGIVGAIAYCVQGMTEPGDGVALVEPVYHPFSHIIEDNGRVVRYGHLNQEHDPAKIDFDGLETVLAEPGTKMLLFCNPHNPIGRVWTEAEMERVCALCVKYGVILVSDEIHSDIIFTGNHFCSAGPVMERLGGKEQLVVCTAASKTFNIAGLQCSAILIPGEKLREKYREILMRQHFMEMNAIGPVATEAAYRNGQEWLDELMDYLEENRDYAARFIDEKIPGMRAVVPEATYMMWIDCRQLGMTDEELERFLVHRAKVALNVGSSFGPGGAGYVRLNFGISRALLAEALERIRRSVLEMKHG